MDLWLREVGGERVLYIFPRARGTVNYEIGPFKVSIQLEGLRIGVRNDQMDKLAIR